MSELLKQLTHHAAARPDGRAIIALRPGGVTEQITFGELRDAVAFMSQEISARSEPGQIVPILCAKSIDCVVAMLGTLSAGSAFAVLNRKLKSPQLNAAIHAARPSVGIIDADCVPIPAGCAGEPIAQLPWLLVGSDPSVIQEKHWQTLNQAGRFDFRSTADQPGHFTPIERHTHSPGCCLFTSGSTGHPKGVLIAEHDLFHRAAAEARLYGLTSDDVILCVLPFSFDVGLNQLLASLIAGCTLILSESWLPVDLLRTTSRFGVTGISGVPAVWNDLIQTPLRFDRSADHRTLRYVTVSGGDLPAERLQRFAEVIDGAGIFKTYGQSETFRSTALTPADFAERPHSVGRPFADAKIYILRPDGTPADPGEHGEVVHAGLGTMLGYLDSHPSPRRPNPFHLPGGSDTHAIFTGDIGHLDTDGFLFIHGRHDAMLKVAGNRVYPKEVVDQLIMLDGVVEAEVLGRKTPTGETQLVVFVTPSTVDPAQVRKHMAARVPSYMVPKEIIAVDALPRTANGKVDHPALLQHLTLSF